MKNFLIGGLVLFSLVGGGHAATYDLGASNPAVVAGNQDIAGTLTVDSATIQGSATVGNGLTVTGNSDVAGRLTVDSVTVQGSESIGNGLDVKGNVNISASTGGVTAVNISANGSTTLMLRMVDTASSDSCFDIHGRIGNNDGIGGIEICGGLIPVSWNKNTNRVGIFTAASDQQYTLDVQDSFRARGLGIFGGSVTVTGNLLPVSGITGVTTNALADAGDVGQISSGTLAVAQNIGASAAYVAIATVTLGAGDWDVTGFCYLTGGGTTAGTQAICAISNDGTALEGTTGEMIATSARTYGANQEQTLTVGPRQIRLNSATVYYLIAGFTYSTLGGAQWTTQSMIRARRIR